MPDQDTIKFVCQHCGKEIEAPSVLRGTETDCPHCRKTVTIWETLSAKEFNALNSTPKVKAPLLRPIVLVIAVALLFIGFFFIDKIDRWDAFIGEKAHPEMYENAAGARMRYEGEADARLLKECSNYVGFIRILDHYVYTSDSQVTNWTGGATIDYINKVGGVERTNLLFCFWVYDGHCLGMVDDVAMLNRDRKQANDIDEYRRKFENPSQSP